MGVPLDPAKRSLSSSFEKAPESELVFKMKEWDVTGINGENSIKFTPFSTIAPSQFVQTAARLEFLQFFPARAPANPQLYVNIADLYKNFPRGHTHRPGHIPGGPTSLHPFGWQHQHQLHASAHHLSLLILPLFS